jgi:hypothetical protein
MKMRNVNNNNGKVNKRFNETGNSFIIGAGHNIGRGTDEKR